MNTLLVSDVYFPRINGVSRSIQILRQELHNQGHKTTMVAPDYDGLQTVIYDTKENILRIPSAKIPFDPEDRLMKSRYLKKAIEYLREENREFDIIHVHTPFQAHKYGIKWARQLNIPLVETYHTYFEEYFHCYIPFLPRFFLSWLARKITRFQCKNIDQLIVPSSPIKQVIKSYGINTPATIIPTGLNNDDFFTGNGDTFKKYYEIEPARPILMYVGRVAHEKNIGFLLHVAKELATKCPEILLVIAGEGPATTSLVHRASELKITGNVKFVGYLSRKKMLRHCYSAADVFVFASRTETQGLVLLEAMAQGIPVVSTAKLGTKDILVDNKGCLIAEELTDDFSRKISAIISDPELHKRLTVSAKLHAAEYSANNMAEEVVNLYNHAIKAKTPLSIGQVQHQS